MIRPYLTNSQRLRRRKILRWLRVAMLIAYMLALVAGVTVVWPEVPWSWQR